MDLTSEETDDLSAGSEAEAAASEIMLAGSDDEEGAEDLQDVAAGVAGWQIAADAIKMALNNRVDDAHVLLSHSKASCVHKQAGYCYLTFIVSLLLHL